MLKSLPSFLLRLSRSLLLAAAFLGTLRAETIHFDSGIDLGGYTMFRSHATTVTVTEGAGSGAGQPASGGLTFLATTNSDSTAVLLRPEIANAGSFNQWSTSILVNFRETDDLTSGEKKTESRIGFAATKNFPTDLGKLKEFFHKTNHSISLFAKADHTFTQPNEKNRRLEFELVSNNGNETKAPKFTLTNSAEIDNWLRMSLTVVRAGATTFNASFTVESLGADGTATPTLLHTDTLNGIVNASLASAATIHAGFTANGDKQANNRFYLDDHTVNLANVTPARPVALPASSLNSSGFTANWQAGTGAPGSGYLLEVTTAADNFISGSFLTATGGSSSSGIVVSGAATLSQSITGLSALTSYVYRVKALNSVGSSAASDVVTAATIAGNAAPTFDAIPAQGPVRPTDGAKTITLTGVGAGGESGQTITLSATSSNPAILPHPVISYAAPAATATLTYDPSGAGTGDVTITVTADDGQADNHTFVRTFLVPVQFPVPLLGFESDAELPGVGSVPVNGTLSRGAAAGVGSPAGGGLIFERTGSSGAETGAALWRVQAYSALTSTNLSSSVFINPREVDDLTTKDKVEVNIGFAGGITVNSGKPQEFLRKTNPGLSVKLNAENDPSDASKLHKLECEVTSWDGFDESKGAKGTVLNQAAVFNHWLKLTFDAVKTGPNTYRLSYRLEDWGADGTALVSVLITSDPITVTNPAVANDPEIWSGLSLSTEKSGVAKAYLDQWETTVSENPPAVPMASNAVQVTARSFLAKWVPGDGVLSTGYVLEATTAADNFASGNFLTANGGTSTTGIVVSDAAARGFRITGLNPSTAYVYRVRGTNQNGHTAPSNVIPVTTLVSGANAVPTLDPIANPTPLNINASQQSIPLTGISAGGEANQAVSISAVSSSPTLVPDPFVNHLDPEETGTLLFWPNPGETGTAVITVTVEDDQVPPARFSQQFTITVTEPETLIAFNDANALSRLNYTNFLGSSFAFGAGAGIGSPAGGGAVYTRTGAQESVLVGFRQTAYDALASPHFTASMFINAREVVNLTSGKDKAELRLAFIGNNVANTSNPKDSMNKNFPSLGLTFKVEHEFGKSDKDRKVEVECFSWNGSQENKGGKGSASSVAATANWLKVTLYVVRGGQDQYYVIYEVADWGPNGTAWQGQVLTGGPFLATNAAFYTDTSVYAGFSLTSEKTSTKNIYIDHHEVVVNTTAADAPLALSASNVRAQQFTAEWAPALVGLQPNGYVLDVSRQTDNFAPGKLINVTGVGGQTNGIHLNSASQTSVTITGLVPSEPYIYRVRAKRGTEESASIGQTFVTTLATDFAHWRQTWFAGVSDSQITGPNADPDKDGRKNLLEYALGLDPLGADEDPAISVNATGTHLRMTFRRRFNAPDVAYVPLVSGNFSSWQPNVTEVFASQPDVNGMQTVIVEDNDPMSAHPTRFMRVRLQEIP